MTGLRAYMRCVMLAVGLTLFMQQSSPSIGQGAGAVAPPLKVDWNDPQIQQHLRETATRANVTSEIKRLDALRLPVLGFTAQPQIVRNVMGATARASVARKIIFDADDPVWYQIVERFGDISVTVGADLRVNHEKAADFQIHKRESAPSSTAAATDTRVSVLDASSEEGMEGVIAEYTVYRFPDIPYTVKIECVGPNKAQCRNTNVIVQDQTLLKIIAASPK